jgi:YD repeat-containing protein
MHSCTGCGAVLDPTDEQVNSAVDRVLQTSLADAEATGGVCPLCGHSKAVPPTHRKPVLFILLIACLMAASAIALNLWLNQQTRRIGLARQAIMRLNASPAVTGLLGSPIRLQRGLTGDVQQDETGWQEARLTFPVRGPAGEGIVRVAAGRVSGPWTFSTFEVLVEKRRKRIDLLSGRVVEYDPRAYVDVHTLPVAPAEYTDMTPVPPRLEGDYPCVYGGISITAGVPQVGKCQMPVIQAGPMDRAEADLRYARLVTQETDLRISDVFDVPLTRTYTSDEWVSRNPVHAFGRNSNHPFDIAPVGTRNPYTYQMDVLADGDFLFFDRVSNGTGYADAVFRHTETATRFYNAIQRWNGNGWTLRLADGSQILFPESYNARDLAQGAATEMDDAQGNRLQLLRDARRNLTEILTPHGHWIRFTYDEQDRIIRAETDRGEWAQYGYNHDGMLSVATLSNRHQRQYQYSGYLMTGITDESGRVLLENSYDHGALTWQRFANGDVYSYRYGIDPNRTWVDSASVTLPDGSIRQISVGDAVPDIVRHRR